jgi:ribosomal-protein-alanine N-acetyltransferase
VRLEGAGVALREFRPADWVAVHSYMSRRDVNLYLPGAPLPPRDVKAFIGDAIRSARALPRTTYSLAITVGGQDRAVGTASLVKTGQMGSIACILHPCAWGRGVGTEVVRLLLAFAFGPLGLRAVGARVAVGNAASRRIAAKAGFAPVVGEPELFWIRAPVVGSLPIGAKDRAVP